MRPDPQHALAELNWSQERSSDQPPQPLFDRLKAIVVSNPADLVAPEFEELGVAGPHRVARLQPAHRGLQRGRPDHLDDDRIAGSKCVDHVIGLRSNDVTGPVIRRAHMDEISDRAPRGNQARIDFLRHVLGVEGLDNLPWFTGGHGRDECLGTLDKRLSLHKFLPRVAALSHLTGPFGRYVSCDVKRSSKYSYL